jgi:hypothetical protein
MDSIGTPLSLEQLSFFFITCHAKLPITIKPKLPTHKTSSAITYAALRWHATFARPMLTVAVSVAD